MIFADKQQEVDIQSLRTQDDSIDNSQQQQQQQQQQLRTGNEQSGNRKPAGTMSQISGVRRSLSHANSLPAGSAPLPKYGVHTDKEQELSEVRKGHLLVLSSCYKQVNNVVLVGSQFITEGLW